MTSQAKSEANRKNAQRSTGPKTPAGKAIAAQNALRHGLTARTPTLPDEDPQAWADWQDALHTTLAPVGPMETLLVNRIASCAWRLDRAGSVEASLFRHDVFQAEAARARQQAADLVIRADRDHQLGELLQAIADDRGTAVTDSDRHTQLLKQAAVADAQRDQETLAVTLIRDASNALTKLSRYETALERGLYRALHELQRLQATRAGHAVSAPAVLDVNVSALAE